MPSQVSPALISSSLELVTAGWAAVLLTDSRTCRCPLHSPPPEIVTGGCAVIVDYLGRIHKAARTNELFMEGFELLSTHKNKLDVQILGLSKLRTLSLCQNRLSELDPRLGENMTALVELYLRANFLRDLPVEMANLESLTVCDSARPAPCQEQDCSAVRSLHDAVPLSFVCIFSVRGRLLCRTSAVRHHLKAPSVDSGTLGLCRPHHLSPDHASLLRSQVLHLDQNELSEISPWIQELSALVDLSISQNQLQFLTEAVGELQHLRKLNLMSNKLLSIPPELCKLGSLISLNIDNNPLRSPPKEVNVKGFGRVIDYLRRCVDVRALYFLRAVCLCCLHCVSEPRRKPARMHSHARAHTHTRIHTVAVQAGRFTWVFA